MKNYKFGDILLLQFSYTDKKGIKKRPALVLIDTGDNDIIVVRITTQMNDSNYEAEIKEWEKSGLISKSYIRLHKIATLEKSIVDKKLGELQKGDIETVKAIFKKLWFEIF